MPQPFSFPALLDSALQYLQDTLPPPIYSLIVNLCSHALALFSSSYQLISSLVAKDPRDWDAQTVLPPLISIFIAYLALLSLYRTTSWMIRTSFWFAKWGSILAFLMGGMGYLAGNAQADGNNGLLASIFGMLSGNQQDARSHRQKPYSSQRNRKPKAWESFETHREWQYQQENDEDNNAQNIIRQIAGMGEQVLGDRTWWKVAKGMLGGDIPEAGSSAKDAKRKQKAAKGKHSQSR